MLEIDNKRLIPALIHLTDHPQILPITPHIDNEPINSLIEHILHLHHHRILQFIPRHVIQFPPGPVLLPTIHIHDLSSGVPGQLGIVPEQEHIVIAGPQLPQVQVGGDGLRVGVTVEVVRVVATELGLPVQLLLDLEVGGGLGQAAPGG